MISALELLWCLAPVQFALYSVCDVAVLADVNSVVRVYDAFYEIVSVTHCHFVIMF